MPIKNHPIADNRLRINNKDYVGLGIQKVIVGIPTNDIDQNGDPRTETIVNERGLHESRTAVESKEIYCLKTQRHSPWFILDLETGSRGWFPGSKIKGDILNETAIKAGPGDSYENLEIVSGVTVELLDITRINQEPEHEGWYKVKYNNEGYVKTETVANLHYE